MITPEQGYKIMLPRIEGHTRHEHYERTVDRRKLYHAMMTGDDIEDYLTRFECREDQEQFEARKKVTQQCVTPAINEAAAKFYKTSRYPNIKKELKYEKDTTKLPKLEEALKNFCHEGDVQGYLASEFDRRSLIDPNSFLLIDFDNFDAFQNEKPGAYGVFIPCDNVVDFEYLPNDQLNWLMIERAVSIFDKDSLRVELIDYIGYLGDHILVFEEVHEDRQIINQAGGEVIQVGSMQYYYYQLHPMAGQVPAHRLGYIKDPITNYKTVVSPLDNAETVVMDLNNDKSEYDQTKRFHVFPQKYVFVPDCDGVSTVETCHHGYAPDGNICKKCKGSGLGMIHTSSSDVVTIRMPKDKEDFVLQLSEMSHYSKPDIEVIKHLREDLESAKLGIIRAIFTTESAVKTDGSVKVEESATKTILSGDDLNNILLPFCEHKSKFYKFIVRQIALYNDLADKLQILFEYPPSLRLETVEELQEKFGTLVNAGASSILLDDIESEIATKRFIDDPEGLKRFNTWKVHRPFRNRPSEEVQFAIGSGSVPKWLEVLWANYGYVMTTVESANAGLYDMPFKKQADLIKAAALELAADLETVEPKRFLGKPGEQVEQQEEEAA